VLWGGTAGGITGVHEWIFRQTPGSVHVQTNESFAGEPVEADAQAHWEGIKDDRVLIVVTPERFQWRYDE